MGKIGDIAMVGALVGGGYLAYRFFKGGFLGDILGAVGGGVAGFGEVLVAGVQTIGEGFAGFLGVDKPVKFVAGAAESYKGFGENFAEAFGKAFNEMFYKDISPPEPAWRLAETWGPKEVAAPAPAPAPEPAWRVAETWKAPVEAPVEEEKKVAATWGLVETWTGAARNRSS